MKIYIEIPSIKSSLDLLSLRRFFTFSTHPYILSHVRGRPALVSDSKLDASDASRCHQSSGDARHSSPAESGTWDGNLSHPSRALRTSVWWETQTEMAFTGMKQNNFNFYSFSLLAIKPDEIIRQVTINCTERGLLLLRVRDEINMRDEAYERRVESLLLVCDEFDCQTLSLVSAMNWST